MITTTQGTTGERWLVGVSHIPPLSRPS
jgi:hypothetical protein